jgi:hypothetical protein
MPSHFVPPLSDYALQFQGETRIGGKRMVTVSGECDTRQADALLASTEGGPRPTPEPEGFPEACFLSAAYDPDDRRFVYLSFGGFQPSYQFRQVDCSRDKFQTITNLAGLPAEVLTSLRGMSDLADHDAAFEGTDVVGPERLPSRRFVLAAVDVDRALVAVEHGGLGYNVEVWMFERLGGHWDGEPQWLSLEPRTSTQTLLHSACV